MLYLQWREDMKTLILKNLATNKNNNIYAFYNTYKIFYKKKNKFDIYLIIWFLILMILFILIFWWLYEQK